MHYLEQPSLSGAAAAASPNPYLHFHQIRWMPAELTKQLHKYTYVCMYNRGISGIIPKYTEDFDIADYPSLPANVLNAIGLSGI